MSTTEIEEIVYADPFRPFRFTLSSGDQYVVPNRDRVMISGLSLVIGFERRPDGQERHPAQARLDPPHHDRRAVGRDPAERRAAAAAAAEVTTVRHACGRPTGKDVPHLRREMTMATTLDLRDVGLHLADVVTRVRAGEEITIADAGEPVARLVPVTPNAPKRLFGSLKGQARMTDDFDAPLPDDLLAGFEK